MIKIENLKKTYDKGKAHAHEVLHGISLDLPDTGFVCILGSSGCGKTTLLNAIGGLDSFDSGAIISDGKKVTKSPSSEMESVRNSSFGYIFQNYYLLAEHSAAYNVFIGMHSLDIPRKEKLRRVKDALARVDMQRFSKRPVNELSGGQQQRVAIARAIARRPKVIFADEPTGNLDEANTLNICSILKELSRESLIVMVTHEERIANFFADRIIRLRDGRIIADETDWVKGEIDASEKDAIYSADYTESHHDTDGASIRLLTEEGAPEVSLTVVVEKNRIIIKSSDPRVLISSETNSAPYLREGERPVLRAESGTTPPAEQTSERKTESSDTEKSRKRGGLSFKMLISEARSLVSGGKLKKFGTGVFIIILSLLVAISAADLITVAHIDPESFITTDSHILSFDFQRSEKFTNKFESLYPYIAEYREAIEQSGVDVDFIPPTSNVLTYTDTTIVQLGSQSISFGTLNRVNLSRFDESTLIMGRLPERSDEVIVDRWLIEKVLSEDGILQNSIPSVDYLLGKKLNTLRKQYEVTIVGICDSSEPAMYMSTEAILAYGANGAEVITLSEYKRITGDTRIASLERYEAAVILNETDFYRPGTAAGTFYSNSYPLKLKRTIRDTDPSITAKIIINDEDLEPLYRCMISETPTFSIWCADKEAVKTVLKTQIPEDLLEMLSIEVIDKYSDDMSAYSAKTSRKIDARTIVTATLVLASIVMLYLMQRSKVRDQMDLVTVYRLLGIRKMNLVFIFAIENLILTIKFALPTVFLVWLFAVISDMLGTSTIIYPVWAAVATLAAISLLRLIVAVIPLLRMLTMPPARLAAKYDF